MILALSLTMAVASGIDRHATAQQGAPGRDAAARAQAEELRRAWLRRHLPELIPDQAELAGALARVDQLTSDQMNDLMNLCLDELELRRRQQFDRLRETNARERAFHEELRTRLAGPAAFLGGPPVGYFPVVVWLPQGTSLSARAVVSPDRRSVRMSLMPFFSTIGPVYTFNYMTGETRRLPDYPPPSPRALPPPPRNIR